MTASVSNAVAERDNGPQAQIERYRGEFAQVLPSHVKPETWTRLAVGALRRDRGVMEAASNSIGSLLSALLTAARLGLEPGTEQFYLVPQSPRKGAPKEILGVVGYQGLVELMYRAGAISSVIVEVVHERDEFDYVPGRDERPTHKIDWRSADRGGLVLAYAYAVMKDGATSKVVVLNASDIAAIKAKSASAHSDYSPWRTNEKAMWLKSAARQLAKWVPTSAEYRRSQIRDAMTVHSEVNGGVVPAGVDADTGEILEGELLDDGEPLS
jgi:recombination protein RecT